MREVTSVMRVEGLGEVSGGAVREDERTPRWMRSRARPAMWRARRGEYADGSSVPAVAWSHRGVPRMAAGQPDDAGGDPRRGWHAAGLVGLAVRGHRLRGVAQGRGRQPDRVLQGPRHDGRRLPGGRGRCQGRRLRVDRQHQRLRGGLCRPRRTAAGRCSCRRAGSRRASSPRRSCTVPGWCRCRATSTTA